MVVDKNEDGRGEEEECFLGLRSVAVRGHFRATFVLSEERRARFSHLEHFGRLRTGMVFGHNEDPEICAGRQRGPEVYRRIHRPLEEAQKGIIRQIYHNVS